MDRPLLAPLGWVKRSARRCKKTSRTVRFGRKYWIHASLTANDPLGVETVGAEGRLALAHFHLDVSDQKDWCMRRIAVLERQLPTSRHRINRMRPATAGMSWRSASRIPVSASISLGRSAASWQMIINYRAVNRRRPARIRSSVLGSRRVWAQDLAAAIETLWCGSSRACSNAGLRRTELAPSSWPQSAAATQFAV